MRSLLHVTGLLLMKLLLPTTCLLAQAPFFSTLTIRDGLPSNVINSIAQDQHGFIWVGTTNQLARYDGYQFRIFKKSESLNSLSSNEISTLLADGDHLWVGTWRGLSKVNVSSFEVTRVEQVGNEAVRALLKDGKGNLWVGTASGLLHIHQETGHIQRFTAEKNGLSHNTIRSLYEDPYGNLWVGTYDKLNLLRQGETTFISFDLKKQYKPSLKNNLICAITPADSKGAMLWVGTETGLCLFNTYTKSFVHYGEKTVPFSNEVIKHIYRDNDGLLWLGTDFGLNVFNPETGQVSSYFHNPQTSYSVANNVIWQIFEDNGGVLWFVTSNGLSRINKSESFYEFYEVSHDFNGQVVGNEVKSVLVSLNGIIWLGTLHGVISFNPQTGAKTVFNTASAPGRKILLNNVFALEEDEHGRIWIGTAGGINVWDASTETMHAISANPHNGLLSNYIAKFTKDDKGNIWVGAWEGGLFKITGDVTNPTSVSFQLAGDFGSEKHVFGSDFLWAVKYNDLFKINPADHSVYPVDAFEKISGEKDISAIYASADGNIWTGTQNALIQYQPAQDTAILYPVITGNDLLLDNIIEDNLGNIWGTANNSIVKLTVQSGKVEIFPIEKDIPLKNFFNGASARMPDGKIIFGGDNGYLTLSPDVETNVYQPDVYITSLQINNKQVSPGQLVDDRMLLESDISQTSALVLDNAHRSISFGFSALHYWQPSMNVYAYMLEGFDTDWNYVSGLKNFAVYSNLAAGNYTFKVKGTNNHGVWSNNETSLALTIKPHLFLSTGFLVLYALLAIIITWISLRIYSIRLKLKNEVKLARMETQHAEELAQTKQRFFTNISHELRTPISLIIPPIHQILKKPWLDEEARKLIGLAEKNSQRLLRLVNQILDFRKLENDTLHLKINAVDLVRFCSDFHVMFSDRALRKEITFRFASSEPHLRVLIDNEKIETVVFNLLSNAFKFTPAGGTVSLNISKIASSHQYPRGAAAIQIRDSGSGIHPAEQARIFEPFFQTADSRQLGGGTGIGLALAAEYVKLHHGEIAVDSEKGKGACFTVLLPMGSLHFPADLSEDEVELKLLATRKPGKEAKQTAEPAGEKKETSTYSYNLPTNKPLVLLIDDNRDMIDLIKISLKEKYEIITAADGEEGLQKASDFLPQVIISDVMMPVMDGLTLCRKIKEKPRTSPISMILLTANSLTSQKIEGVRLGADIYLTKPFDMDLLEAHIDHLLERKQELEAYFKNELMIQPAPSETGSNEDEMFLKKVMSSIEANIGNSDFGVEALSSEMCISSTHLYRKLKLLTHLSANDIIKKYRLKKASLLLKNKEGNISEIMYDVGFSNVSYFSKCFKAEFGVTPKEYQQKNSRSSFNLEESLDS